MISFDRELIIPFGDLRACSTFRHTVDGHWGPDTGTCSAEHQDTGASVPSTLLCQGEMSDAGGNAINSTQSSPSVAVHRRRGEPPLGGESGQRAQKHKGDTCVRFKQAQRGLWLIPPPRKQHPHEFIRATVRKHGGGTPSVNTPGREQPKIMLREKKGFKYICTKLIKRRLKVLIRRKHAKLLTGCDSIKLSLANKRCFHTWIDCSKLTSKKGRLGGWLSCVVCIK